MTNRARIKKIMNRDVPRRNEMAAPKNGQEETLSSLRKKDQKIAPEMIKRIKKARELKKTSMESIIKYESERADNNRNILRQIINRFEFCFANITSRPVTRS